MYVINVKPGISTTDLREQGFVEKAKELGLTYVGRDYSNDKPETAAAKVKAALAKNPDIKGIFATNLFSAEGAATGVREAGAKASRSSASTPARSRSRTSSRASCRP